MKHKLFGKLALSAALLGTAAVPVHASGADTSDVPKQPGKSAPIQAATTISILPNPVELAEKYAPETVQDWKETLEKYGKLAGAEGTFFFSEAAAVDADNGAQPVTGDGEFGIAIAVKATPAVDINGSPGSGDIKEFKAIQIKEFTPLEGTAIEVAEAVKTDAGVVKRDVIHSEAAGMKAVKISEAANLEGVKISDEDLAFIHARIDLFKAVGSKDSDAIKEALAKLLDQYKEQIAKLEAEAK